MKRAALVLAILYLLVLVIAAAVIHSRFNTHWLVTLFLFSPRWVAALPLLALIPLTLRIRWRLSWIYVLHVYLIFVPIMGYALGGSSGDSSDPPDPNRVLRVLTFNVAGGKLDQEKLADYIREQQVQVVMLQECPSTFSKTLFGRLKWSHHQTYRITIGSSLPLSNPLVLARPPESPSAAVVMSCDLQWPLDAEKDDRVKLVTLHLPTFRPAFEWFLGREAKKGAAALSEVATRYRLVLSQIPETVKDSPIPLIAGGDFNAPVESNYYLEQWSDFQNAHSVAGSGFGYTKWTRHHGVRIDHLLANQDWSITKSWVGSGLGSDHRPVIAELTRLPKKPVPTSP